MSRRNAASSTALLSLTFELAGRDEGGAGVVRHEIAESLGGHLDFGEQGNPAPAQAGAPPASRLTFSYPSRARQRAATAESPSPPSVTMTRVSRRGTSPAISHSRCPRASGVRGAGDQCRRARSRARRGRRSPGCPRALPRPRRRFWCALASAPSLARSDIRSGSLISASHAPATDLRSRRPRRGIRSTVPLPAGARAGERLALRKRRSGFLWLSATPRPPLSALPPTERGLVNRRSRSAIHLCCPRTARVTISRNARSIHQKGPAPREATSRTWPP